MAIATKQPQVRALNRTHTSFSKVVGRVGRYAVQDLKELKDIFNSGYVRKTNWCRVATAFCLLYFFLVRLLFDLGLLKWWGSGWGRIQSIAKFLLEKRYSKYLSGFQLSIESKLCLFWFCNASLCD